MRYPKRVPKMLVRTVCGAIVLASCQRSYTHHTDDEVRGALQHAGIIGAGPDPVEKTLRNIRLKGGEALEVGQFIEDGNLRLIEATVEDAKRTGVTLWMVNIVITFDSTKKASDVDVKFSAVNPM